MASFKFEGLDVYIKKLQIIGPKGSRGILKYALYPGAAVVADAVRSAIESQATDSGDLASSIGLAPMRDDGGYINTRIVFAGYDHKKSKSWPNGVPNALKAAVLESGTSKRPARHIISRASRAAESAAESAIEAALDDKIGQIMED